MLPKTRALLKSDDGQKKFVFFYSRWWLIRKSLFSNKIFLKTKIKFYYEVADFCDKENPRVASNHTCLAIIRLDSGLNKYGNYCPQVSFRECKYNKKKVIRQIMDGLESYSDYSDEE